MLSLTHKFLFVHVPKTGGNSVQDFLRKYSADLFVRTAPHQDGVERFELRSSRYKTVKHSTLRDYQREYGPELLAQLFKFCCVRNPWDRCISYFFSPHRGQIAWNRAAFLSLVEEKVKPLRYYASIDPGKDDGSIALCVQNFDFVIRYEQFQADFDIACQRLNVPISTLPRRNASGKDDYRKYYDSQTADFVFAKFSDEITYFGYSL